MLLCILEEASVPALQLLRESGLRTNATEVARNPNTTRRLLGAASIVSPLAVSGVDHGECIASVRVEKLKGQPGGVIDNVALRCHRDGAALGVGPGVGVDGDSVKAFGIVGDNDSIL